MKRLAFIALVLLVLLFLGIGCGGGAILRTGLEKGARSALGVETKVASATLHLLGGAVGISGIRVGNPAGFRTDRSLSVDDVAVDADLGSLLSDTLVVERIEIRSPEMVIEASAHGTNLGALLDRLKGDEAAGSSGGGKGEGGTKSGDAGGKKLRVAEVRITGAKVRIAQSLLGKTETTLSIGDLTLRELGSGAKRDETTLRELLAQILGAIAAAAAGSEGVSKELAKLLDRETADAALDSVRRQVGEIGAGARREVEEAAKGLRDLLKRK